MHKCKNIQYSAFTMSVRSQACTHTCSHTHRYIALIIISRLSKSGSLWISTAHLFSHLLINTSRLRQENWTLKVTESLWLCICVCEFPAHVFICAYTFSKDLIYVECVYFDVTGVWCVDGKVILRAWKNGCWVVEQKGPFHLCRCHINASGWGGHQCTIVRVCVCIFAILLTASV